MVKDASRRIRQVNRLIQEELAELILTEVDDVRLRERMTVTGVETSRDLRHARVFVSIRGDAEMRDVALSGLKSQAKHLRYVLGQRVRLKYLPELNFLLDQTRIQAERIEKVLRAVLPDSADAGDGDPEHERDSE